MADTIKTINNQGTDFPLEDTTAREQIQKLRTEVEAIEVPTKISDLKNDTGFITSSSIPKNLSSYTNDMGYITSSEVPKKMSELNNDAGYAKAADYYMKSETYSAAEIDEKISEGGGGGSVDLSKYYKKTETYSQSEVNQKFTNLVDSLDITATEDEVKEVLGKEE